MKHCIIILSIGFTILVNIVFAQAPMPSSVASSPLVSDEEIRRILAEWVESKQSVGIVVGVIEPQGRRIVGAYPRTARKHELREVGPIAHL
jgi:hypothetical protein